MPTIIGELKRHFRDRTWMVRPPRGLQELTLRVEHAINELTHEHDRSPTVSELARNLDGLMAGLSPRSRELLRLL